MGDAQSVLQQFNWHFNKDKTKDRILWEIIFQNAHYVAKLTPYHFFLSANLGPALCNSCVMLILSYLQAAPTCTLFCISCIQNAVITGFPNQPRTYFHAHILFHEWSAVAISIYIGCRQGDKAWWQSFSQLEHRGPKLNKYEYLAMFFPFKRCGVLITF